MHVSVYSRRDKYKTIPLYKKEIEQKNDFPSHSLYQHSRPTAISAGRNSHPIISHLPIRKLSIPSCLF